MERTRGPGYVPALDGVRGVAVLAVLLFHGGVAWLPGGFLGVDTFFVLSGYLITGLLLSGQPLRTFWERRARRLLPALLLLVGVVLLLGVVAPIHAAPRDALGALTYLSNWRSYATGGGYFASFAEPSAFQHTWSLAVEAQFYLVWPLVVVLVCRRARGSVLAAAGVGAVVSAGAMAVSFVPFGATDRAYYGTDTRIQALLVGAALAVVLTRAARPRALAASGLVGVVLTSAAWHLASGSEERLYGGGFLLAAVGTAAVIASAVLQPTGPLARVLSAAPLRLLGRVSYGVYLWHWPVFLLMTAERTHLSGLALLAARLGVTAACAAVSWHLVEVPARTWTPRLPPLHVRRLAIAGTAAFVAAAFAALAPTGTPGSPAEAAGPAGPAAAPAPETTAAAPRPAPAATASAAPSASARAARPPRGTARVLVLGDSVAQTLAAGLHDGDGVDVVNEAVLGCGLLTGRHRYFGREYDEPECGGWPDRWRAAVNRHRPDLVAVLVGRWEVMDRRVDGEWRRLGDPAFDAYVTAELERAVDVVTAGGTRMAFLTAPYYRRGERPDGGRYPEDDPARVDRFNALLRDVAARRGVPVVELGAALAPEGTFTRSINGVLVRYDGVHVSAAGARLLRPWLLRQLHAALP